MSNPYDGLTPEPQPLPASASAPAPGDSIMGKSFLSSKTVWVNLLTAAISIGVYFQNCEVVAENPEVVAGLGMAVGFVNVILRLFTKEPINGVK